MSSSDNAPFRITVWPGSPLPVPNFLKCECQLSHSGGALFILKEAETVDSHGEIYLELVNVDLDDERAIAAFANKYSVLHGGDLYKRLRSVGLLGSSYPRSRPTFPREQKLAVSEARYERAVRDDLPALTKIETIHEFRFAASIFVRMVEAWQDLSTWRDPKPPRFGTRSWWGAKLLSKGLPALLGNYTPALTFQWLGAGIGSQRPELVAAPPVSSAPLFEVCAFELFNHIVQENIYRRCENETCGRLFVHQQGRARYRQNRNYGVKYCSHQCAQAQNQRTYRRRKRAKLHRSDEK